MNFYSARKFVLAFALGALAVFGYAPFSYFPVVVLMLAVLFWQWLHAGSARQALWLGFAFGMGLFCVGTGWIYVALHDYGDMSFVLAVLATALFAAVCAALPAMAGYVQSKLHVPVWARLILVMPASWVLLEWVRGLLFTGFPWLTVGYAQVPLSPLAGYAPLFGVYGASLAVALSAGLLVLIGQSRGRKPVQAALLVAILLLWGGGAALRRVQWTQPEGTSVKVALVQGNIPQELKFRKETLDQTLETYRRLVESSDAQLVILPETALPMLRHDVPESYAANLREHVKRNSGDLIIGAFENERGLYYNSVITLGLADSQSYRKNHLVPFGEFIPLRPLLGWLINDALNIPMSDLARGGARQPLLHVAGQRVAVAICYEDVFGEELIRYLPEASLLVNVSNDAWYGNSNAAIQHNQISQMRAVESGRMMLRATNTGVTSIIGHDGAVQSVLPQHTEGMLTGQVQGYVGSTPYVRWGNAAVLGVLAVMLAAAWSLRRK